LGCYFYNGVFGKDLKHGVGFETHRHRGTEKDRRENRERPEKRVGERKSRGELRERKEEGVKKKG